MANKNVWERNFADDPILADKTSGYFVPRIRTVRTNRLALEEAWWRFFNMWNVTKDGYHSYTGRAQMYIPEVRKNIEAQARQLTKSAFPGEDSFDVSPGQTGSRKGALAWRSYHQWAMNNCDLPLKYFVAMRQQCMLGTCPIYLPWRHQMRKEYRSRRLSGKIVRQPSEVELFNGPDFIVRDMFRWYTFNPKKTDLSDGCFEIMPISKHEMMKASKQGDIADLKRVLSGPSNAYLNEEFARDVMRAESMGLQIQFNMAYSGEAVIKKDEDEDDFADTTYMRTRIFADMVFPEACEEGEDPDMPIPMMVDIYGNNACGLIKRNPFAHQTPPYVVGRYIQPNADEFYGQGIPWSTQFMQYEMNTKSEQGLDSATMSLNPIAIIDPGLAGESNFDIEPGAKWFANPAGVKFSSMPDVTPISNAAIMQLKTMMQDYSDRSPALPPQLTGKSRTATQSEMVFNSLGVDNWLFQLQNERYILCPMLQQWEAITDQNLDDKRLVMILGRRAGDLKRTLLSKSDLIGRYSYQWKGASSVASKQTTARQMLDALKVYSTLPQPAQTQINFNFQEFYKIMWTTMWGLADADKVLGIPEEMVTQDAEAENHMLKMGLEIEVLPMDDDNEHIQIHDKGLDKLNKSEQTLMMAHMLQHKKADEQKQIIKQQMQQQQQQQQQMQSLQQQLLAGQVSKLKAQAHKDDPSGGSQGGAQGSGNRTQLSPGATSGDIGSGVRA